MRWQAGFIAFVLLAIVGVASADPGATTQAQEGTPCPLWPQHDPDIVSWEVGQFMQWPSTILVEFAPGARQAGDDGTTGAQLINLIYIQTGVFTLRADVPMAIHRGEAHGDPEIIPAGTEFTAEAGDYFVTGAVTPAIRNDGPEPASYQSALIDPLQPLIIDRCAPLG